MQETRVLLVFPGSLYGGRWADGPRSSRSSSSSSRSCAARASTRTSSTSRPSSATRATTPRARRSSRSPTVCWPSARPDLVVVSCWSALQYSAALAVAERVRRQQPDAVIAVQGYHVSVRPDDFNDAGAPFDWLIAGEAESVVVTLARAVAAGERETGACHSLEGTPLALDAEHVPDYAAYPYTAQGLPELGVFLSRGCPYNAPACLLRPGGGGWHAYPPTRRCRSSTRLARCGPATSACSTRPSATRRAGAAPSSTARRRRPTAATSRSRVAGRPDAWRVSTSTRSTARACACASTSARSRASLLVADRARRPAGQGGASTRSTCWPTSTPRASPPWPLHLQSAGETEESAAETLDALERFVAAVPPRR